MHAVFCFVEDDGGLRFKDFFGDFHAIETVLLVHLFADFRVAVVKGGQAVQELTGNLGCSYPSY